MSHAPHIQRAINALCDISDDYADFDVTTAGEIVVLPYWAPECVDPDGRPIGTAPEHRAQWGRVTEALDDAGWEPHYPAETPVERMGRLLNELTYRLHGGSPVVFRYAGGEE